MHILVFSFCSPTLLTLLAIGLMADIFLLLFIDDHAYTEYNFIVGSIQSKFGILASTQLHVNLGKEKSKVETTKAHVDFCNVAPSAAIAGMSVLAMVLHRPGGCRLLDARHLLWCI
jgi:hypothetical protein